MKVIIQTPHLKARTSLISFVKEKLGKLETFSENILECRVYLKIEKSSDRGNKVCELKLIIPGSEFFASSQQHTFEEAVLHTIEAVKPQIERWKGSKKGRFYNSLTEIEKVTETEAEM